MRMVIPFAAVMGAANANDLLPDLVVEKSVAIENDQFTVSYTVTNQGGGPAGTSTTYLFLDGVLEQTQPCPALGPGVSHSDAFNPEPCPCLCGETLEVQVCADCADVVYEGNNEDNNCEVAYVVCVAVGVYCCDAAVTITDQDVTDNPASDPGTYDPTNIPPYVTWTNAKGLCVEADAPDGTYQFCINFETPVEIGFTLYKLPNWTEVPYTVVAPDTIQVELDIVGGILDPCFVLAGKFRAPMVPAVNQWGIIAIITLFAGLLVWTVCRRIPSS